MKIAQSLCLAGFLLVGCGHGDLKGCWEPTKYESMNSHTYIFLEGGGLVHTASAYGGPITNFGSYREGKGLLTLSLDGRGDSVESQAPFEWKGKGFILNTNQPREYRRSEHQADPLLGIWKREGDPQNDDEVGFIFAYNREAIIGNSGLWNEDNPRRGPGGPYSKASYQIEGNQLEEKQDHRRGVGIRKRTFKVEGDSLKLGELTFQRVHGPFPIDAKGFHPELWQALK